MQVGVNLCDLTRSSSLSCIIIVHVWPMPLPVKNVLDQ